ncbi:MAG: hypothetical protein ACSLFP_00570 [Acidimicrobiales bacterium]
MSTLERSDAADSGSGLRRAVVDAYDRLADRILHRLRSVHDDLGADLAEVRTELTALRQTVEDLGERVQLRQLRSAVDELRSDVTGLRRVVLEWPELERVSSDIAALRADMTDVVGKLDDFGTAAPGATPRLGTLAPLMEEITALREEMPSLDAVLDELAEVKAAVARRPSRTADGMSREVVEELAALRTEVAALRRRISLRAGS